MISTTALAVVVAVGVAATGASKPVHACRPGQLIRLAANACRPSSCAAKKACNPCAVKKAGNPCATGQASDPCAAKTACNPCAAGNPCNPCVAAGVAMECVVPRLVGAYHSGNPCAVKKPCNPCTPCGAMMACNPCAASKACSPCSPCNPCAASNKEPPELSDAEAVAAYDCVSPHMAKAYRKSCHPAAVAYRNWQRLSRVPYPTEAHGVRFMNNYANEVARADYGKWEAAGDMPSGSVLAKDSFIVGDDGKISVGPLFLMTKAAAGTNAVTRDWQYTMIMPSGGVRQDAAIQKFCNDCHRRAGAEDDFLMFLPLPFRISAGTGG